MTGTPTETGKQAAQTPSHGSARASLRSGLDVVRAHAEFRFARLIEESKLPRGLRILESEDPDGRKSEETYGERTAGRVARRLDW